MEILDKNNRDIEILCEFAKNTNRNITFKEIPYPTSYGFRLTKYRTTVYIHNNQDESSYFICFWDPYHKIGEYTNFSGVFIPISLDRTKTFNIREKNILDKLNPFSDSKNCKTGFRDFDSKVVITGNDPPLIASFFHDKKVQNLIIQALKIKQAMWIGLNDVNVEFVPGLKNKSHFCIYNSQGWFLENSQIEKLFEIIEEIRILIGK